MLTLFVQVMAVRRIVRLVTRDVITRPARNKLATLLYPDMLITEDEMLAEVSEYSGWRSRIAYGVTCRLCVGVWAAMLVVFVLPRKLTEALGIAHIAER